MRTPVLKCFRGATVALGLCLLLTAARPGEYGPTELFLRGYTLLPAPQSVRLEAADLQFGAHWTLRSEVPPNHIAVRSLARDLAEFHSIALKTAGARDENVLRLAVAPGTVNERAVARSRRPGVPVAGRAGQNRGHGQHGRGLVLRRPVAAAAAQEIERRAPASRRAPSRTGRTCRYAFLHWDTKHHQDRIDTLKRYLDWSARFKINRIGFELEDKFAYPSHPVIGAPGAFTPAELQEIVDYGLERFIEVVPQIQSPAHMAYVLKHPEFADLRADGNNYQACLCDDRTYALIFSMYDDVMNATRGVRSFHVSTDEVYFAGICSKCTEPYTPENRSLKWVQFAQRAHEFLQARGRTMLAWVEYPVLPQHIRLLPQALINGVMPGDREQLDAEKERGIRDLIYTSMEGEEPLFPNYLPLEGVREPAEGRLDATRRAFESGKRAGNAVGVYGAAWDDSGLHGETFWLGWAAVAAYGWNSAAPPVRQQAVEFMTAYYGPEASGMTELYLGLQKQARFFESSWDRVVSRERGPGYGNSEGPGVGTTRYDKTLPAPALPALPGLDFSPVYQGRYGSLAREARQAGAENETLQRRLYESIVRAGRNRYNLEVFLSLASLTAHHSRLVSGMADIEALLLRAREAARDGEAAAALGHLTRARALALSIASERKSMFADLQRVWEKSRYPKGREVNGRKFVHVLDDTKDHWADRRPDLTYMTQPEESIGLEAWADRLGTLMQSYAQQNKLALRAPED